jgi:hypothetical protein
VELAAQQAEMGRWENQVTVSIQRGRVGEFDSLVLESALVRATILPALGGRVWELEDRERHRQWIWHRDDVPLAAVPMGSCYDDVWAGGWEELFPNDAPGGFEGRDLPDHGEWWTLPWTVCAAEAGASGRIRLEAATTIRAAHCSKEFFLDAASPTLRIAYRIESLEPDGFHFLFKQHLPVRLTPGCRLAVPGGNVRAVEPGFGTLLPGPGPYPWPLVARDECQVTDLRIVPPPTSGAREFVYVTNTSASWVGVDDFHARASLRLHYDRSKLPFLWLFLTYGGWRNCYTAVLEPCTNMPKDLDQAVRQQQAAYLAPAGQFTTQVAVTVGSLETEGQDST